MFRPTRRAIPIPLLNQGNAWLNPSQTNRSHNSAKSLWTMDIALTIKDASSLTASINWERTMNTTQSTRLRNVEVLKTITSVFTEIGATLSMWLFLHRNKVILQFAAIGALTFKWNWSEDLPKKSQN